jgi:hypothetical protein
MNTHFTTNNYWRFTWERQLHGTVLARSVPTGLYYYHFGPSWRRSAVRRQLRASARAMARQED